MAANIPADLKTADITRFAVRASQLEQAKPVIAYWCNYWIVNQILAKGLHNSNEECMKYTAEVMDKLERFKAENVGNDAITDDVAGHAYVEEFGLDTFQRADNAVRANKATRQTADTFQAAATFLELCNIWGNISPELAAKVKFAKYHALRIAKAIKAGEDPNLSNPTQEEEEAQGEDIPLDPNDPEVQALQNPNGSAPPVSRGRQPSVEEIPDETDRVQHRLAQQSSLDESLHPSRASSNPPRPEPNIMNIDGPKSGDSSNFYSSAGVPDLPAAPSDYPQGGSTLPDAPTTSNLGRSERGFPASETLHSFPPPTPTQLPPGQELPASAYGRGAHPSAETSTAPHAFQQARHAPQPAAGHQRMAAPAPTNDVVDEESIALAQKHARWAVSALNFEDVNTAITELKKSLGYLGA